MPDGKARLPATGVEPDLAASLSQLRPSLSPCPCPEAALACDTAVSALRTGAALAACWNRGRGEDRPRARPRRREPSPAARSCTTGSVYGVRLNPTAPHSPLAAADSPGAAAPVSRRRTEAISLPARAKGGSEHRLGSLVLFWQRWQREQALPTLTGRILDGLILSSASIAHQTSLAAGGLQRTCEAAARLASWR